MLMADEARRVRRPAAVVFSCEQCKEMFGVASWRSWWLSVASWPECAVPGCACQCQFSCCASNIKLTS